MRIAHVLSGGEPAAALGDAEFAAYRELVESSSGIHLADHKRALLVGRLGRRVRELGLDGFGEYLARVRTDASELIEMLDRICTNETRFFREPQHFELLERRFLAELGARARARGDAKLRAWSAACSTGEEPYSLAMTMRAHLRGGAALGVEVVGTDLSTRALGLAEAATYPLARAAAEIPESMLREFVLRGRFGAEGLARVAPEIRAIVRLRRRNLCEPGDGEIAGIDRFDLIFCRNVLIYFNAATKQRVIARLARHLVPGGLLFLGHAESLAGHVAGLRAVAPTVYAADPR